MNKRRDTYRFLISGGGTGGHIFPAVSIGQELQRRLPGADIRFVGARGRMEMQRVPAAGFPITGLPIAGLQRKKWWKNLALPYKIAASLYQSYRLLKRFKPHAVIGTGGYASLPLLWTAQRLGIPTYVQEQNSFPGMTNKLLGKKARRVFTAYDEAAAYFPPGKAVLTGNPVRSDLSHRLPPAAEAKRHFGLDDAKPVILVLGGSLGAAAINRQVARWIQEGLPANAQMIWQTGKLYYDRYKHLERPGVRIVPFIKEMDRAYAAADLIISRAGAGTLSELALVGKPVILIPSPNVAEDHQTKNARAFSRHEAAVLLPEKQLDRLPAEVEKLLADEALRRRLAENIKKQARPDATRHIVDHILNDLQIG